jgi:hypothetical protein
MYQHCCLDIILNQIAKLYRQIDATRVKSILSSYITSYQIRRRNYLWGLFQDLYSTETFILGILPSLGVEKLALFKLLGSAKDPSWASAFTKSPANPPFDNYFLENYH